MRLSRYLIVSGIALLPLAASGCSDTEISSAAQTPGGGRGAQQGAVPVTVAPVVSKAMPIEIRVIGSAEPFSTVAIRSQITGQLTSVNFTEGDDVKQGQVLFALDRRPLEAALQQAAGQPRARHGAGGQRRVQAKRYEDLAERGIAPREQVDTSRTDVDGAERHGRRRPGRGRERESAAAVRDDHRADLRPHRRADGARGQPRARQRPHAARGDQSGRRRSRSRSRFRKRGCRS